MVKLWNGVEMPDVGLGTYKMTPEQVLESIPIAYSCGYRLFDTAAVYKNEAAVAQALSHHKDYFVTTKLAPKDQGYEQAKTAIHQSLSTLKQIDLFLIHWPGASALDPSSPQNYLKRRESWKALEEAYAAGFVKAIGVSNYEIRHLQEMKEYAQVMPMVNQIEVHPLYYPHELIQFCSQHSIVVQAYSSLAANKLITREYLENYPVIQEISNTHGKTAAQVLLKWALQHGLPIIPKSTHQIRIKENIDLFDFQLTSQEMSLLDQISKTPEKVCWDPSIVK